jgi:hypothetical protein
VASDDDDDDGRDLARSAEVPKVDPTREILALFEELEDLLKNGDVIGALTARGVNASLALTAIDGLRAYLAGDKADAAEDLALVAEEIRARLGGGGSGDGSVH